MSQYRPARGFTLIEVLIALSILALSLTAILKATNSSITKTKRLEDITYAHYVAENALSLVRLNKISARSDEVFKTTLLTHDFHWTAELTPSPSQISSVIIAVKQGPTPTQRLKSYRLENMRRAR